MKVIGITGGVGSGKSAVLKLLEEEYHAVVVQLDEVAKALQRKGTPCWKAIVEAFGREILDRCHLLHRQQCKRRAGPQKTGPNCVSEQ